MEYAAESARQAGRAPSKGFRAQEAALDAAPIHPMLQLQRAVGNQAVMAMLRAGALQAKLSVGAVDDPLEHEADRVADQVMSASLHSPVGNAPRPVCRLTVPASVNLRRPGGPFSDPRLIGARAYTLGNDIVLADNVDVESAEGERILSHELVHVAQAKARGDSTVRRFRAGDVKTQSVGPDYATQLTETELEQDIAFLQQLRAGLKPDSIDYQVASDNLKVLGQEADRRGYKSPALTRGSLIELFKSVFSELKRVADFLPHLEAEFKNVTWIIPWRPDKSWSVDPMDFIRDQFMWMVDALSSGFAMIDQSIQTDHDMSIALLRLAGVRVSSVMLAFSEIRPFLYYLQAAIGLRYGGPWMDPVLLAKPVENARARITPDLAAFAKLETESLDSVAASSAATTQALFGEIPGYVKSFSPAIQIPKLPWQAEALVILLSALLEIPGGAVAGEEGGFTLTIRGGMMPSLVGGGSMGMTAITISAEQIAALRRLVAIGAISTAAVSASLGTSLAVGLDLPPALTDLIGEGPTAGAMHATGKTGAGMARHPRHHVMPQEEREWFEERGMTDDLDIDQFTVDLEEARHQAIHGGGNWRLGRTWPGEWNTRIMDVLRNAEAQLGRRLRPSEILNIVGREMRRYGIPMDFVPFRAP